MEEIKILNEVMPVIEINFESVKTALTDTLTKYQNFVVTEDTLKDCKATQKELAGARKKIDTYRKDKKKTLSEPITAFENQCKELIGLIEKAEKPIKDGIEVFDDKKRAVKKEEAEEIVKLIISEQGLNEKYGARLGVLEKYCNLTAKKTEVKEDVSRRAFALKVEQDREQELLDIIKDSIETENERLNKKLKLSDFDRLIKIGATTKDILAEIKLRSNNIYDAEHPASKEEPKEEPLQEPKEEFKEEPKVERKPQCFMEIHCTGTLSQLRKALELVRANGVTCEVTSQGNL